jgi:hypothetical protein
MATPIGRPVSPTYTSATPPAARVAPPASSSPALETSKPVQTQASFAAARQSVVGKSAETVNPSQGGAQVKQGIDQVEPGQLLEQGQGLMESPVVKSEFGISEQPSSSPTPQKAVYALGDDSTVVGSAQSLSEKQGHTAMNQSQLRSLGSEDKLILVGHGDDHRFGGMDAEQLAGHLKEAGVTSLKKISLKGCNSADYAIKLFSALQKQGIEVECITGKTGNAVIAKNGRTLVEQEGQMLHQAVGNTIEVTKAGVKYKHEGDEAHSVEAVKGRSSEIEGLGHDGALGTSAVDGFLNDIESVFATYPVTFHAPGDIDIRNLDAFVTRLKGDATIPPAIKDLLTDPPNTLKDCLQNIAVVSKLHSEERYQYLTGMFDGLEDSDLPSGFMTKRAENFMTLSLDDYKVKSDDPRGYIDRGDGFRVSVNRGMPGTAIKSISPEHYIDPTTMVGGKTQEHLDINGFLTKSQDQTKVSSLDNGEMTLSKVLDHQNRYIDALVNRKPNLKTDIFMRHLTSQIFPGNSTSRQLAYVLGADMSPPGTGSFRSLKVIGNGTTEPFKLGGRPAFASETLGLLRAAPGQHRRHITAWHSIRQGMERFLNTPVPSSADAAPPPSKADQLKGMWSRSELPIRIRLEAMALSTDKTPDQYIREKLSLTPDQTYDLNDGLTETALNSHLAADFGALPDLNAQVKCTLFAMNSNPGNLWLGKGSDNSGINTAFYGNVAGRLEDALKSDDPMSALGLLANEWPKSGNAEITRQAQSIAKEMIERHFNEVRDGAVADPQKVVREINEALSGMEVDALFSDETIGTSADKHTRIETISRNHQHNLPTDATPPATLKDLGQQLFQTYKWPLEAGRKLFQAEDDPSIDTSTYLGVLMGDPAAIHQAAQNSLSEMSQQFTFLRDQKSAILGSDLAPRAKEKELTVIQAGLQVLLQRTQDLAGTSSLDTGVGVHAIQTEISQIQTLLNPPPISHHSSGSIGTGLGGRAASSLFSAHSQSGSRRLRSGTLEVRELDDANSERDLSIKRKREVTDSSKGAPPRIRDDTTKGAYRAPDMSDDDGGDDEEI